ncbi:MAG TPA: hypothetical protein VNW46_05725 [Gemmatimonadaceae bacterium]|nr:hypothetical protein [Gemmatimonadaceae bacterium]
MRIVHALVMTAAVCMAGVVASGRASAQGRGGRGGGQDTKDTTVKKPGEPGGPMDPERPIPFMIEHRREIALVDSQVSKLGIIANRLDAADRPVHLALDTLPAAPTGPIDWAHITPAGRDSVIARRRITSQVNATMHDNALAARNDAFAVLTPDQLAKLRSVNQQIVNRQDQSSRPSPAPSGAGRGGQPGAGGRPY